MSLSLYRSIKVCESRGKGLLWGLLCSLSRGALSHTSGPAEGWAAALEFALSMVPLPFPSTTGQMKGPAYFSTCLLLEMIFFSFTDASFIILTLFLSHSEVG